MNDHILDDQACVAAGPDTRPYPVFRQHATGKNDDTHVVITESIRAAHPDSHVTTFEELEFDLFGWAATQNAQITPLPQDGHFLVQREYVAAMGSLTDRIVFGQYKLLFQGDTFLFYKAEWRDGLLKHRFKFFYLLTSNVDLDETGLHSRTADDLLRLIGKWTAELHDEVYVFDRGDWVKNARLWKAVMSTDWDEVILDPAMKVSLMDDVHGFFDSQQMYHDYSMPWKRGLIFHGPPGCGKTMTIKSLIMSLKSRPDHISSLLVRSFRTCDGPEIGIEIVFNMARNMTPCLLVFEGLDSMVVDEVRSYFLNQMDGLESNDGILVITSTNHLDRLDPGISNRPSRFDKKYYFAVPSTAKRLRYCEHWESKLKPSNVIFTSKMCAAVAEMTDGFSFAYLKELFVQSLLTMARANGPGNSGNDTIGLSAEYATSARSVKDANDEDIELNPLMCMLKEHISAMRVDVTRKHVIKD